MSRLRYTRLAFAFACAFLLVAVIGCGGKPKGTLTGPVTLKDKSGKSKPVVAGTVTAFGADNMPFQGEIRDGKYTIPNVVTGPVTLTVISDNPGAADAAVGPARIGGPTRDVPKAAPIPGWFALPGKYRETSSSPLKTTVTVGDNNYPIELVE